MSKQEEIKQSLAAATPGPWKVYRSKLGSHEETLIGTEYDHPQLKAPDSIVGHAFGVGVEYTYIREADADLIAKAPEYIDWLLKQEQSLQEDIMVLKDMVNTRNVENERLRKEIIVKDNSKEILTKQITDEVTISATAIVERNRLCKALSDVHNALRWGDAENALERVESIIEQALGQKERGAVNKKRKAIYDKTGGRCFYCGSQLGERGWHADHVEAIRRNWWTDTCINPHLDHDDNKVPACASCNLQKGPLTIEQFREKIAGFVNSLNSYHNQYIVAKRYGLVQETVITAPVFWFERVEEGADKHESV